MLQGYYDYIQGVQDGSIVVPKTIKKAVNRLERLKAREDIYFDEATVKRCFEFIRHIKHYAGKSAGQQFDLLPYQKWIIGSIIGIKYKDTGYRVCRETLILQARKNGKTALVAALSLYMLIADGEAAPNIGIVASSREQASIAFTMIQQFSKTLDPDGRLIKNYRNYIKTPANIGELKVFSADASRLDGLSESMVVLDEGHAQRTPDLYNVMKSSMGFRTQPLLVQISTSGYLLDGYPLYSLWQTSLEILDNIKTDDSFFPFIYQLDPDDDWEDEDVWIKSNPALDVTVTKDYIRSQIASAKNDISQMVGVKTKTLNMWCPSSEVWIPQEKVAETMETLDLQDYEGQVCYIGVDLSAISDLTALSVMIPTTEGDKTIYRFWNWAFLPSETYENSPNKKLYERFMLDGQLILTEGNVVDYQAVINKIAEINQVCPIEGIFYDVWNATQFSITCTDLGYNMVPFKQNLLSFNGPTKELEKKILQQEAIFDKSAMMLWCFGNVVLATDTQGNIKPSKAKGNKTDKIDPVIASVQALGGYLCNPISDDYTIMSIRM